MDTYLLLEDDRHPILGLVHPILCDSLTYQKLGLMISDNSRRLCQLSSDIMDTCKDLPFRASVLLSQSETKVLCTSHVEDTLIQPPFPLEILLETNTADERIVSLRCICKQCRGVLVNRDSVYLSTRRGMKDDGI